MSPSPESVLLDSYYTLRTNSYYSAYIVILLKSLWFKNRTQHRAYDALGLVFCFSCKANDYSIDGRNTEYYQCPRVYIIVKGLIFMIKYQAFFHCMDRFQTMYGSSQCSVHILRGPLHVLQCAYQHVFHFVTCLLLGGCAKFNLWQIWISCFDKIDHPPILA